ncbi:phiSA1p31-related protein [Streptomyces griseofuscus]|uniref:phiSA1p31-related protein n=1 Tax=Streptomyces griseofuscus TaxID=146922 RepID=UPI0033DA79F6
MTETFEVGQRVKHQNRTAEHEVSYGPFTSPLGFVWYVIRNTDTLREDTARGSDLSAIPEPPKFAVGDKVTSFGDPYTILAGPFRGCTEWYVVEDADGKALSATEDDLVAVTVPDPIKVGDRVRIVRATCATSTHGREGVITSTSETWREEQGDTHPYIVRLADDDTVHVAEVERIDSTPADTYEHDGVTYDLSARYRDRDGDVWKFERIGDDVYGDFGVGAYPTEGGWTLASAARHYGPLTRVND